MTATDLNVMIIHRSFVVERDMGTKYQNKSVVGMIWDEEEFHFLQ